MPSRAARAEERPPLRSLQQHPRSLKNKNAIDAVPIDMKLKIANPNFVTCASGGFTALKLAVSTQIHHIICPTTKEKIKIKISPPQQ